MCIGVLAALAGCAVQPPATRHAHAYGSVYCDRDTPEARAVRDTASQAVKDVVEALALPEPLREVDILVFPSAWAMRSYLRLRLPERANSRAVCVETESGYLVALHLTGKAQESVELLRHEMTHYVLASHFFDMPPWVDEGLARYFETGPPFGVAKPAELRLLKRALNRREDTLDGLVAVPAGRPITEAQYAQSWALVHFLAHRPGGGLGDLVRYLRIVRSGAQAADHFEEVFGEPPAAIEPAWRAHVRLLAEG